MALRSRRAKRDSSPEATWTSSTRVSRAYFINTNLTLVAVVKAKALYAYEGANADELPLVDGDILSIVDKSEADWWKAEKDGMVFIVPAGYLELIDGE
jgi:uncharacterized protein YaiE (UPF0345 family)